MAVIGGFRNCGTVEEAKTWITSNCTEFGFSVPLDMWCSKSGWKGMLFAKFADASIRDQFALKYCLWNPSTKVSQFGFEQKHP